MWFVDQADITAKAGDGGRGSSACAQPPYIRYPYPDGGDGGDGGDVVIEVDVNCATLLDFHFRHEFAAGRGGHGGSNNKSGKRGDGCVIRVPMGTVVSDCETHEVLGDLTRLSERIVVARGGRGGEGNASRWARTKVARRGQPRARDVVQGLPGRPGQCHRLRLELKLIADVGIVGFPNAGKSSLLARISTARPKVAPYPFTTRYPVLGVVKVAQRGSFVACDIPGLIEGAHTGKGLGLRFLRHIERTRMVLHMIDMACVDGHDPVEVFHQVHQELQAYSAVLGQKPQLVVANKMDVPHAKERLKDFQRRERIAVWPISCATGEGIPALLDAVWHQLNALTK